eukprot:TRINITY_DN9960_c0_g1_i1.p2 TRINITY_DN9960_c0_g1~~TRINITY_DN9960_c0_g1_i1.p2  ORF type:complete len:113 (+),score=17.39 TRINITY_DN9960_c0_g1_i1:150-488(+)
MLRSLVGSEMCIRDRVSTQSTGNKPSTHMACPVLLHGVATHSCLPWSLADGTPDPDPAFSLAPVSSFDSQLHQYSGHSAGLVPSWIAPDPSSPKPEGTPKPSSCPFLSLIHI